MRSMNQNQNQNNLYSTHVVAVQTKYYCIVLNVEIVWVRETPKSINNTLV